MRKLPLNILLLACAISTVAFGQIFKPCQHGFGFSQIFRPCSSHTSGPNLLTNPTTINVAPWIVSAGTATGATTATSSGAVSIQNGFNNPAVTASTTYTATMTVAASGSGGTCGLFIYSTGYASTLAGGNSAVNSTPHVFSFTFNSGIYTSVIFELDCAVDTNGETITVTNSSLNTP